MLVIATAVTLEYVLTSGCDPGLTRILQRYKPLLADEELAVLFILQPGDRSQDLATLRGRPFDQWEFIGSERGWFEAVFVLDDYGHGHAALIPDTETSDPDLLNICREHAVADC